MITCRYLGLGVRILMGAVGFILLTPALSGLSPEKEKKKEKKEPTVYTAYLAGVKAGYGGRSRGLTIRIEGYTSDEKVQEYLDLIREKETWLLRDTLEKVRGLGRIAMDGFVGNELAVIRQRDTEGGKLITLVTARNMAFVERAYGIRSRDYPYSFLQLLVDEEGKGHGGTVIGAARARFNKEGILEIESYGVQPFQLFNIQRTRGE